MMPIESSVSDATFRVSLKYNLGAQLITLAKAKVKAMPDL